jgi:hypothetical protein
VALSRPKLGFESPWGHLRRPISNCVTSQWKSFWKCYASNSVTDLQNSPPNCYERVRDGCFNTQISTNLSTEHVIANHISVLVANEISGYNAQYLRRLLRAGKLDGVKVGQVWLINLTSLQTYFSCALSSNDMRFGPKRPWHPPF